MKVLRSSGLPAQLGRLLAIHLYILAKDGFDVNPLGHDEHDDRQRRRHQHAKPTEQHASGQHCEQQKCRRNVNCLLLDHRLQEVALQLLHDEEKDDRP